MIKEALSQMINHANVNRDELLASLVGQALDMFPASVLHEEDSQACFEQYRDLVRAAYPTVEPMERILKGFEVLSSVIRTLDIASAKARYVHNVMRQMYNDAVNQEDDIDL